MQVAEQGEELVGEEERTVSDEQELFEKRLLSACK